jgi:FMN phosphatase YigB (HAD superfamily)
VAILEDAGRRKTSHHQPREKFAHARALSLLDAFGIVVSAHERLLKTDPRIYALLCERHGLAPDDCIFIDDSLPNVEGARAFGMLGHHFREASALRADLKARGLPLA